MNESRIRILPDALVDMIAAGEVVERPASIVKELLENALDAQAHYIEVQIRKGGIEEITVVDDGCGMTPDELALAVLRHATSKIRESTDLERIHTFGFRGEALPSIASVSRMTLLSRTRDMDTAYGLVFDGRDRGRRILEACAPGTRVTVKNLFYNVPARLKFLKSEATETAHIQDVLTHAALAMPNVHFRLISDDRTVFDFPPQTDRLRRITDVLARRVRTGWYPLHAEGPEQMQIELYLSPPEVHISEASGVYLFVNQRPVRDRMLLSAITSAYGGMLPKGRYPLMVLFLELPTQHVDVNVHPQKTQVRFRNERQVAAVVRDFVQRLLIQAPWLSSRSTTKVYQLRADVPTHTNTVQETNNSSERYQSGLQDPRIFVRKAIEKALDRYTPSSQPHSTSIQRSVPATKKTSATDISPRAQATVQPASEKHAKSSKNANAAHDLFTRLPETVLDVATTETSLTVEPRYLGCHDGLYLMFELPGQLVILDMHAASERIRYEEILTQMRHRRILSQGLLIPLEIEATNPTWEEFLPELTNLGFEAHIHHGRLIVSAVPAVLALRPIQPALEELFDAFTMGRSSTETTLPLQERLAATMACHSALRKNDSITPQTALELYRTLQTTPSGGHCPHGRPVMVSIANAALEALFHRR